MTDETLDILLIEDNPGDARLIREMLRDSERLLQRFDAGGTVADEIRIHHEEALAAGLERAETVEVDCILLDLGLPDSTGLDTLTSVTDATVFVPVVVLTGLSDEAMGINAIQHGAQDYLVKDEVTADLLVRSIHYALERTRQERERARRREQLEALNRLNEISQDVTHAVITTSTREDLERAVCERLVESDAYRFAWIGEVNPTNDRITPRVAAGVEEGYLDEVTVTATDGDTAQGPAGTAVRTQEVAVVQNAQTDPDYEPWRAEAVERGYRSGAAVPILHEDLRYGVLNLYSAVPNAFSEPETEILSRLGDVIGHAISAIERKEALVSDTVVEFEFAVEDPPAEFVSLTTPGDGRITVANVVRTDETVLAYGRAERIAESALRDEMVAAPLVDDVRILSSDDQRCEFEVLSTAVADLVDAIATHGGRITGATVADGSVRFVVEYPPGRDKRQLIDLVETHCPSATNRAQRTVQRSGDDVSRTRSIIRDALTDKQRIALETAVAAGLFEWPRTSTGQELAERLDVAPATFSQRLRAAQKAVFEELVADRNGETDDRPD